jgi:hypothetical protein
LTQILGQPCEFQVRIALAAHGDGPLNGVAKSKSDLLDLKNGDVDAGLLQLLTSSADWLLNHNVSGICLRRNGKCEGVHPAPAWTGKSDDDGGNYVTGNLQGATDRGFRGLP